MKDKVHVILQNIYQSSTGLNMDDKSLLIGHAGIALYNILFANYVSNSQIFAFSENEIQVLAESATSQMHSSFCTGKAGINWMFTYLHEKGFIFKEDLDIICEDDRQILDSSIVMLKSGNYDFLHGGIGIAYYLLAKHDEIDETYFPLIFELLEELRDKSDDKNIVPNYSFKQNQILSGEVNLGLAHGIPSLLKFYIQCFKLGVCSKEARLQALNLIDYLLSNNNVDNSLNYFPSIKNIGDSTSKFSRLAWCYGDLGVGYILYQAGLVLNDSHICDYALDILIHSTKRKMVNQTLVMDAGFCHGSAGIAHIYNKMWHYTENKIFKSATEFWINKTIEFSAFDNGIVGYKRFISDSKGYENSQGLLEGVSGIGLVLLSYITGDYSWDYCLMLN